MADDAAQKVLRDALKLLPNSQARSNALGNRAKTDERWFFSERLPRSRISLSRIGMSQRLLTVAAWLCFGFIVYATLSSQSARPELTTTEPPLIVFIERFGAYAVLGCLFRLAHPRRVVLVSPVVLGSAVLLELLQIFVPDRDARISDALEKLAGGFVGIVLANAIQTFSGFRGRKI